MKVERVGQGLGARLRARQDEIETALTTRVLAIGDSSSASNPAYVQGLRAAVRVALEFGVAAIESTRPRNSEIPLEMLSQARFAARKAVSLDTVLRRYLAGYTLLGDFVVEEAEKEHIGGELLKRLLRSQAIVMDQVLAGVSDEYEREAKRPISVEQGRVESVKRLLAGQLLDPSELGYEFELRHVGALGYGAGVESALRDLGASLGCLLLLVRPDADTVWAWLGARGQLNSEAMAAAVATELPPGSCLAFGEPGEDVTGWRLTHRQAKATLPVARQSDRRSLRYAEVALVASICRDDLLLTSLRELYLRPLEGARRGVSEALDTLRAYFAAERNVSSAAAALGISRQTFSRRLCDIEERLGRPLRECALELEAVLILHPEEP